MTIQKIVIAGGLVAVAVCGLFPPWLYTFYTTGTTDRSGYHSELSAGHCFLLTPPLSEAHELPHAHGIKLDIQDLLVEWVCVGAITGAAWVLAGTSAGRPPPEETPDH